MSDVDMVLRIESLKILIQVNEICTMEAEFGVLDSLENFLIGANEIYEFIKEGKINASS
jgi:hypothetical protein